MNQFLIAAAEMYPWLKRMKGDSFGIDIIWYLVEYYCTDLYILYTPQKEWLHWSGMSGEIVLEERQILTCFDSTCWKIDSKYFHILMHAA